MKKLELSSEEFDLLRNFVQKECGIAVGDEKSYLIQTRLASLVSEEDCDSFGAFYAKARSASGSKLRDKIIDAMTTNETLWFRDQGPWHVINRQFLPACCAELQSGTRRRVRIWSAAASTGQEPYSVAISILEFLRENAFPGVKEESFEILGTDISPSALFIAISGRYDGLSIKRGLEEEVRDRYFEKKGRVWAISDRVKRMVRFQRFNLMDGFMGLGHFDLVLCRNVLIYFEADLKRDIVDRMVGILGNSGTLIVGASESLQGCAARLQLVQLDRQFFYRVKAREQA